MNGLQAVQSIMATAIDPSGITTAIRIGAAVATSAANVIKISATKFNGGTITPTVPAPPAWHYPRLRL